MHWLRCSSDSSVDSNFLRAWADDRLLRQLLRLLLWLLLRLLLLLLQRCMTQIIWRAEIRSIEKNHRPFLGFFALSEHFLVHFTLPPILHRLTSGERTWVSA